MLRKSCDYILDFPFDLLALILVQWILVAIIVHIEPLVDCRHKSVYDLHQQFCVLAEVESLNRVLRNIKVEDLEILFLVAFYQLEVEVEQAPAHV